MGRRCASAVNPGDQTTCCQGGETRVLEVFAACAGLGLLLSLRYRVPALIAATALLVPAGSAIGLLTGWPLWIAVLAAGSAAAALQCGYLAGLLAACGASRAGLWPFGIRRPSDPG